MYSHHTAVPNEVNVTIEGDLSAARAAAVAHQNGRNPWFLIP
jgi:hypothetical protein